jgi:hypothetical protein
MCLSVFDFVLLENIEMAILMISIVVIVVSGGEESGWQCLCSSEIKELRKAEPCSPPQFSSVGSSRLPQLDLLRERKKWGDLLRDREG